MLMKFNLFIKIHSIVIIVVIVVMFIIKEFITMEFTIDSNLYQKHQISLFIMLFKDFSFVIN